MGRHVIDLTGRRFDRLTVVGRANPPRPEYEKSDVFWSCNCSCGRKNFVVRSRVLKRKRGHHWCDRCQIRENEEAQNNASIRARAYRRLIKKGTSVIKIAELEGITRQAIYLLLNRFSKEKKRATGK